MKISRSATGRRWRVRTGAAVAGPPLVADGMVYGSSWDYWVYAVDAATGRVAWRWQSRDVTPRLIEFRGAQQVAAGGGNVYVGRPSTGDGPGTLLALDGRTGEPRWHRDLGADSTFDLALGDDSLIVCGLGELRCHDADDGTTRWRYRHPEVPGIKTTYNYPIVADGVVVVVISMYEQYREIYNVVVAVAESDGSLLWEASVEGATVRPTVADGTLYVGTGVGVVAAATVRTGEVVWSTDFETRATESVAKIRLHPGRTFPTPVSVSHASASAAMSQPVVAGDHVYVASRNAYTYQVNRADGTVRWRWDMSTPATAVGYADGLVYAGRVDGTLSVFPDTGEGYLWATSSPVGRISGMTIVDGVIYVSGDPYLATFDALTGHGPWHWPQQRTVRRR